MHKYFSVIIALLSTVIIVSAQEKKGPESPRAAMSLSQELLWGWNSTCGKLITMAEDFPEDKYNFKAQKDERTFGGNLLHVAFNLNFVVNAIKGTPISYMGAEDSLRKKYQTRAEIVSYLKQAAADGAKLISEQGDSIFTKEFVSWGNRKVHLSMGLLGCIEHAGEHYGQLVVYYRLNDMVPPQSRPRK